MSQLKHPNIIRYYDWFVAEKYLCIVMEFASGGTLQEFIKKQQSQLLPEQEVVYMLSQLVHGLHYIHNQGMVHRDLKPSNILLQHVASDCVVKIADFGISKILETTCGLSVMGTACYLAPELCEGLPHDKTCDIWALGCILYEMMTLKKAFEGHTLGSTVRNILQCQLPTPNTTMYGTLLRNLLDRLLNVQPAQRPSTSMIMADPAVAETCYKLFVNLGRLRDDQHLSTYF
ncbi:hypothetical protein L9F63_016678 [Diploptera punctata]|uniref:non-specific serine/threonine protein kinase n=1 Tax=Diploptera punctata TaxID=6984 RepID=A0AAD8EHJ9_DIPPU|nr:hypothetical protein L9F63_016678 [Diploptera punctata]